MYPSHFGLRAARDSRLDWSRYISLERSNTDATSSRNAADRASSTDVTWIAAVVSAVVRPVISSSIGGVPFSPAPTGVLGLTFQTSPEGYVAFSLHPQLLLIARRQSVPRPPHPPSRMWT